MPKVRFLVTQTGDNQFKQLKKSGTMITLSYAFHGQNMDNVSIAMQVTGPKEAVEQMFAAWPIAVAEHFFVDVISDPTTIAQALAAQAASNAGKQPAPKKTAAKPAKQPAVAGTPASGATTLAGQSPAGDNNAKEGEGVPLDTLSKEVDALAQEEQAAEADEDEDSEPEGAGEEGETTGEDS